MGLFNQESKKLLQKHGGVTHEDVRREIQAIFGQYDKLLTLVRKTETKMFFYHVSRSSGLARTILQGTVKGKRQEVDRRKDEMTLLKSGQEWILLAQQGKLTTRQAGKGLLRSNLGFPVMG